MKVGKENVKTNRLNRERKNEGRNERKKGKEEHGSEIMLSGFKEG